MNPEPYNDRDACQTQEESRNLAQQAAKRDPSKPHPEIAGRR
jgi:hypothetical protein